LVKFVDIPHKIVNEFITSESTSYLLLFIQSVRQDNVSIGLSCFEQTKMSALFPL